MKEQELYLQWKARKLEDEDLNREIEEIEHDEEGIFDRFYRELEFGTGGLRGVIGAGTNRMNIYTVRRATQGLAQFVKNKYENPSAAISYDSRIKSDLFAKEAAKVLAANGIKVYLASTLMPTPMLSFAVRDFGCKAGIMVTASHNPSKYNGYKAYGPDGCQMNLEDSEAVIELVNQLDMFDDVRVKDFDEALQEGSIEYIDDGIFTRYLAKVKEQAVNPGVCEDAGLKVVYTPLNGTGNVPVRRVLGETGVTDVHVVKEQEMPDGNFPTCPYPNPEFKEALAYGLKLCEEVHPDLLLATDPDADRIGIAVADGGDYKLLTGNEVGALLFQYIASCKQAAGTMPEHPIVVKTIVTTNIIEAIAKDYGVEVVNVLTGFKFIGEQIALLEAKNEAFRYLFGFEESYGYLCGTYVRDKDAVVASMLICEMAAYYKKQGKSLVDVLNETYEKYGRYYNRTDNFAFEGAKGMQEMAGIMAKLRAKQPKEIGGLKVLEFLDYQASRGYRIAGGAQFAITLPSSDVVEFKLEDNAGVIVRPSGTEPKIKFYYTTKGRDTAHAQEIAEQLSQSMKTELGL